MAPPLAVEERRLVDDVGAGRHRVAGGGRGGAQVVVGLADLDADDGTTGGVEGDEVALLVLEALATDDVELGIDSIGPDELAQRRPPLELGQVGTGEVPHEIRGGEHQRSVDLLHPTDGTEGV